MPPSSSNVILRRAEIADLATIASIIAHSPDDAASWTYPTWRDKATESTPIYIKKFSNLFKNPQFKIRVAQQDGAVVGYAVWVRTERTSEGQVERVSSTKEYDQDGKFLFQLYISSAFYFWPLASVRNFRPVIFGDCFTYLVRLLANKN